MDTKKHILFVDDEEDLAELYQEIFESNGLQVSLANSAQSAIEQLERNISKIDLIISDFQMPRGNADLIIDYLNTVQEDNKPKIILLSAYANQELEEKSHSSEIELLKKPIALKALIKKIEQYLNITLQNFD